MRQAEICNPGLVFGKLFHNVRSTFSTPFLAVLFLLIFTCLTATVQGADSSADITLPEPTGRVVIEVSGNIERTNGENSARFDYQMLEDLGLIEIKLDTPWTEPDTRFEGVLTRQLLEMVGAKGTEVLAEAADGYSISLPISDLIGFDTLLALSMNGKRMRLRNKGPAWILYDAKDRPNQIDTILNSRMVWQLRKLVVK